MVMPVAAAVVVERSKVPVVPLVLDTAGWRVGKRIFMAVVAAVVVERSKVLVVLDTSQCWTSWLTRWRGWKENCHVM
jgi:hypothetical protein